MKKGVLIIIPRARFRGYRCESDMPIYTNSCLKLGAYTVTECKKDDWINSVDKFSEDSFFVGNTVRYTPSTKLSVCSAGMCSTLTEEIVGFSGK